MLSKSLLSFIERNRYRIALAGVVLMAFFIRWSVVYDYPIWSDEANLVINGEKSWKTLFLLDYWDVSHPPLYNMFIKFWEQWGTSARWLRLPTQITASLSLLILYGLVKSICRSREIALLTSFLAALSGFLVSISIFVRPYGFQQVFVLAYIWFWHRLITSKAKIGWHNFGLLVFYSVWATLNDYSFLWVLVVMSIVTMVKWIGLVNKIKELKKYVGIVVLSWLPFLFWLPVFISRWKWSVVLLQMCVYDYAPKTLMGKLGYLLQNVFSILHLSPSVYLLIFVSLVCFYFGVFKWVNKKIEMWDRWFLGLLLVIPIVTSCVSTQWFVPILVSSNQFVSVYPYLIVLGLLIDWGWKRYRLVTILLLLIFMGHQINQYRYGIVSDDKRMTEVVSLRNKMISNNRYKNYSVVIDDDGSNIPIELMMYYFGYLDIPKSKQNFVSKVYYKPMWRLVDDQVIIIENKVDRSEGHSYSLDTHLCSQDQYLSGSLFTAWVCSKYD